MAAQPVPLSPGNPLEIDNDLRELLHLRETGTHYITQSLGGVTIEHPKNRIHSSWQLLEGILAGGADPNAALEAEKQRELAKEAKRCGDQH